MPAILTNTSARAAANLLLPPDSSNQDAYTAPFPVECFPGYATATAIKGAYAIDSTVDVVAVPMLIALSAAVGPGLVMRAVKRQYLTTSNLYGLVAAPSTAKKSGGLNIAFKPIEDFFKLVRKNNPPDNSHLDADPDLVNLNEPTPVKREPKRFLVTDSTVAALGKRMNANKGSLVYYSADARNSIDTSVLGKYNQNGTTDEAFFMQCWSCEPLLIERMERSIQLDQTWLSIMWFIQPDKLADLIRKRVLRESGLMQRFLFARLYDTATPDFKGSDVYTDSQDYMQGWHATLTKIMSAYRDKEGTQLGPWTVPVPEDTDAVFREFYEQCFALSTGAMSDIAAFINRSLENALRVALVLHAADNPGTAHLIPMPPGTAHRAIKIILWFRAHAVAKLEQVRETIMEHQARGLLRQALKRNFTSWEMARRAEIVGSHPEFDQAIRYLVDKRKLLIEGKIGDEHDGKRWWRILPDAAERAKQRIVPELWEKSDD